VFAETIVRGRRALRLTRRRQTVILTLIPVVFAFAVWGSQGTTAAAEDPVTAKVVRGDIVVDVGGVGRIVQAGAPGAIARPSSGGTGGTAAGSGSGSAGGGDVPADAVFPRATGQITKYLVRRGQRVRAGQALAILDDGGVADAAIKQARNDIATARIELRQKQTSDPLKGTPPTSAEVAAGQAAITAAQEKLRKLLGSAQRTDVTAAWLELRRAEAELETIRGGTRSARAENVRIAQRNLEAAQDRLERALTPDPADVAAATAEVRKAEAELAVLVRAPEGPLEEEIAAAKLAVEVAEQNLAERKAANPPDPSLIRAAQLELQRARSDLAVLLKKPRGPTDEEIASAREAVNAARAKLARILRPGGNTAEVRAARVEIERSRAELRRARSGPGKVAIASAKAAVTAAEARLNALLGPPLRADVAAARLEVKRAQADLSLLRTRGAPGSPDDIDLAGLRVETAQIRLESAILSKRLLTVRAPSRGQVTALLSVPGAPVDPTTPIATVSDLERLAVSINLSEFDVAQVRRGDIAEVSVDALGGETFGGRVIFTAATGVESNGLVTFPVQIAINEAPKALKPGMNVTVRIVVARKRDVLQVPLEAVTEEGDDKIVTVIPATGEPEERTVQVGLENTKNAEILEGLREGERVELKLPPPEE
jgi:HlyD family secretion protein